MAERKEQATVEVILKGQHANATLKDLQTSSRALNSDLKYLTPNTEAFIRKSEELRKVNTRIKAVRDDLNGTGVAFKQIGASIKTLIQSLGPIYVAMKVFQVFMDSLNTVRQFEKSVQNLSAITGASGKDLEFFKEQAMDMGKNVEGGAKSVIEAYKLIASAKPELLENKHALNEVTEAAILLAHASGLELPEAATRLTDALNQYGAPASDAAKYTDALAAAAKYGAAEVPQVTDALLQFGTQAKNSNINIYESAAAIEVLAEKGIKGAEAGTMLRNIFTKLAAADVLPDEAVKQLTAAGVNIDILKNKTLPLNERLKELSKIAGNASALVKVFKLENQAAADILLSNIPRLEDLTNKVKENGVANEQAAKNMDTFDQSIVHAGNAWDTFILSLSKGKAGGLMQGIVEGWTQSLEKWSQYLMGTRGKNIDIQSLMMVGKKERTGSLFSGDSGGNALNEDQAKRLVDFGFKVDFVNGKMDRQRMGVVNLIGALDIYLDTVKRSENPQQLAGQLLHNLQIESGKLSAAYAAGKIRGDDYAVSMKLITSAMEQASGMMPKVTTAVNTGATAQVGIIKKLQDEIAQLELDRTNSTSKIEITSMNAQIKRKQELLDTLLGKEKEADRELKRLHKELMHELGKMNEENNVFDLDDFTKKSQAVFQKMEELEKKVIADKAINEEDKGMLIAVIRKNGNDKLAEIEKEAGDKILKEHEEHLKAYKDLTYGAEQKEIEDKTAQFDKEIAFYKGDTEKLKELEEAKQKALQAIRAKYIEKSEEHQYTTRELRELRVRELQEELNTALGYYQSFYGEISNLQNALMESQRIDSQNEIDESKRVTDIKTEQLKKKLENDVISQRQYDQQVDQLNKQQKNKERAERAKLFQAEKDAALYAAWLNSAQAITQIWAQYAGAPYVAAGLSLIAGVALGVQINNINKRQPPKMAKGGYVDKETMMQSASGQPFIAGEAGKEWVAPSWMVQDPIIANNIQALEAVRTNRSYAAGGYTSTQSQPTPVYNQRQAAPSAASGAYNATMERLVGILDRLEANGLDARLNYDEFTKTQSSIQGAKNGSAVR